ncbi:hypothetical protein [Mycolicibacter sinensis]|nr:hypothetical protein [Mycolicibacter sinensis]
MNAHIDDASPGMLLPSGWTTQRLKSILLEPLKYGANEAAVDDDPAQPRFVRITDIAVDGSLRPETFRSIPSEVAQPYMLKEGDLLFARSGATVGKSVMYTASWGPCCFAGYLIRARIDPGKASPQYIRYFSESTLYWQHIASEQIQATIQNVSAERYGNLLVPMPNVAEQSAVVAYLDRETAKIDALIAKQEQLIATLREDRTATITHAVTKGLNPGIEMRDSGVEWLGCFPKHWDLRPLWAMYRRDKSQNHPDQQLLSIYRDHGVVVKESRTDNFNKASADLGYYQLVEPGDLVVNRMKAWQGSVAISEHRGIISPDYYVYKPLHSENSHYLNYLFRCSRYAAGYGMWSTGVRPSQWSITPGDHLHLKSLIPPRDEQDAIAEALTRKCADIDGLIAKADMMIETLREYRSALITDAVTGKIDVRGAA